MGFEGEVPLWKGSGWLELEPISPPLRPRRRQCGVRTALFSPETERAALLQLIDDLLLP